MDNSNLMAAQADMEEAEANPSTTEMLPVTADCFQVTKHVEMLKQSNCASDLSALSYFNKVNSAKLDSSSIENGSMNSYLIKKELNLYHCTDI
ncbi:hypothetical protein J6590_050639 [Homalodisca vitripennis]|nr:hypothetical protein J6590_050639 [Homalodisca vitripennis]